MSKRNKNTPTYAPLKNADDKVRVMERDADGYMVVLEEISRAQAVATKSRRGLMMYGPEGVLAKFNNPASIWEAACDFFDWADNNPKYVTEIIKSGDRAGDMVTIPKERPYTITGLATHFGTSVATLSNYLNKPGYETVKALIDQAIQTRKYEGAAVGIYNAPMMIRDLGLVEKSESDTTVQHSGAVGLVITGIRVEK